MTETQAERLDELIARFSHAMLVTRAHDGTLRARPMAIAEHHDEAGLYFSTDRGSEKIDEIEAEAQVAVTMQGDGRYLSLSGRAEPVTDRRLIEKLFSPSWKLWFPEGPGDPNLVLLRVVPSHGEYWDRGTSRNRLRFVVEAGKALAEGRTVDESKLSGHGKVNLG